MHTHSACMYTHRYMRMNLQSNLNGHLHAPTLTHFHLLVKCSQLPPSSWSQVRPPRARARNLNSPWLSTCAIAYDGARSTLVALPMPSIRMVASYCLLVLLTL